MAVAGKGCPLPSPKRRLDVSPKPVPPTSPQSKTEGTSPKTIGRGELVVMGEVPFPNVGGEMRKGSPCLDLMKAYGMRYEDTLAGGGIPPVKASPRRTLPQQAIRRCPSHRDPAETQPPRTRGGIVVESDKVHLGGKPTGLPVGVERIMQQVDRKGAWASRLVWPAFQKSPMRFPTSKTAQGSASLKFSLENAEVRQSPRCGPSQGGHHGKTITAVASTPRLKAGTTPRSVAECLWDEGAPLRGVLTPRGDADGSGSQMPGVRLRPMVLF